MAIKDLYPDIEPSFVADFANVKALDPRITFARASTGVAYDGVTHAKAEENLLLRSQEFDDAVWVINGLKAVVSNDTSAPDGSTTADKIIETSSGGNHEIQQTVGSSGLTYTVSTFAKQASGTRNLTFRGFGQGGTGLSHPIFDLSNGTVAQTGTGAWSNHAITNVGNGWYRCSATVASTAAGPVIFGMADGTSTSYIGDDTSGLFLWGAQLEQR